MLRYYIIIAASLFTFLTSAKLSSAFLGGGGPSTSLCRHGCGSCGIKPSYGNTIILHSNGANDESTSPHPPPNNNNLSASQRERREEDRRRKLREGTATPGITRYDD